MHIHIYKCSDFNMQINQFFKCLSDETRLNAMLLIHTQGELCVCELMHALEDSQPKISRHLAQLRSCSLLSDTRRSQWVFYAIAPNLPEWALKVLDTAALAHAKTLLKLQHNLQTMQNRPICC